MTNEYGLDVHYFTKNLEQILRDIKCYTPGEMNRALTRLAKYANHQIPWCGKSTPIIKDSEQ